jgi:hypothetical protein
MALIASLVKPWYALFVRNKVIKHSAEEHNLSATIRLYKESQSVSSFSAPTLFASDFCERVPGRFCTRWLDVLLESLQRW